MSTADASESPWASTVVLGNGDTVFIRPLTTDDRPALAAFHKRQSADSIYRRYFSPKPELSEKELLHFTDIDMVDRAALAVESHDQFIAWASYERWPGRNEAEAAFMVDDTYQGAGIATLLLEHLAAIARSNGIERFTAEVLGDNRAMLAVFAKAGWPLQRRFDSGVVDLDWELADTDQFLDSVERREQRADSRAVARILLPRAIAVIGASDRPGSVGDAIWRHIADSVDVPMHAVNPNRDDVHGHHCCRTIGELPDEVSLAIIAVPARDLDATIDACIDKRMRGAVVITSVDGTDIDVAALVTRARRNGLRIIGPSSMGIASPRPETRLQAALVDVALPPGGVAISMQSGSLGGSFLRKAGDVSLGMSWFVSLGDKSDISANDLLQFWEQDDHTTVIGMYTESFGNPRKFARIARARVTHQADRCCPDRCSSDRRDGRRVVSAGRSDRSAHGAGTPGDGQGDGHPAGARRATSSRGDELAQPGNPGAARRSKPQVSRRSMGRRRSIGAQLPLTTRPRSARRSPATTSTA